MLKKKIYLNEEGDSNFINKKGIAKNYYLSYKQGINNFPVYLKSKRLVR